MQIPGGDVAGVVQEADPESKVKQGYHMHDVDHSAVLAGTLPMHCLAAWDWSSTAQQCMLCMTY